MFEVCLFARQFSWKPTQYRREICVYAFMKTGNSLWICFDTGVNC